MKKFAYDIHQLFEVSNVFYRIMFDPNNTAIRENTDAHKNPLSIILVKYPAKIVEVAQQIFILDIHNLKLKYNS